MKKLLGLIGAIIFLGAAAFASSYEQAAANKVYRVAEQEVQTAQIGRKLLNAAANGQMKVFRNTLAGANKNALLVTDENGNNILHVARNKQIFDLAWNVLDPASREQLLAQRNKTGETPLMAHIVFGHENIFISYFPQTELYRKLQKATAGLQAEGLVRSNAEIERDELIKQCSIGGVTMWQRAQGLAIVAKAGPYAANSRQAMDLVQQMIADVAPFLVK